MLDAHHFDHFVETRCGDLHAGEVGRPALPPGICFCCLMVDYLGSLDSERGIAWRVYDFKSLKLFLGHAIDEITPDYSTISRTRRLIALGAKAKVFPFILKVLANCGLTGGRTARE